MILFPAIDLKEGQCVRLYKGRFEDKTVYSDNPAAMAEKWAAAGARWLHLVDLDGSLDESQANREAIIAIRKCIPGIKLQLGGGIRSLEDIQRWIDLGIDRLIVGTIVCEKPELLAMASAKYPGKMAVALDAVGDELKTRGWTKGSGLNLFEVASGLKDLGASVIIYTDVERDGSRIGPNLEKTVAVAEAANLPTIASGGIASLNDLEKLKALNHNLIIGAITGKAIYEGDLDYSKGAALLLKN